MNYFPTQEFQFIGFVFSIVLGFFLGTVYDLLKIIFLLLTRKANKLLNLIDILFSLICLFASFIYFLVMCEGQILFYAIFGELIGFSAHLFSVKKLIFNKIYKNFSLKIAKHICNRTADADNDRKKSKFFKKILKKDLKK